LALHLGHIFVCARVFKSNLDNDFSWGSVFLFFFLFENRNAHITPQNSSRTLCSVFLTNVCLVGKEGTQNHKYKSHITILFLEFVSHLARIGGCLSVHDKGCRAHAQELWRLFTIDRRRLPAVFSIMMTVRPLNFPGGFRRRACGCCCRCRRLFLVVG